MCAGPRYGVCPYHPAGTRYKPVNAEEMTITCPSYSFSFPCTFLCSQPLLKALSTFTYFGSSPAFMQKMVGKMLADFDWIDNVYLPECRRRMRVRLRANVIGHHWLCNQCE